ncbi:MAG TPA: sigma-54 dependent transcriptional regulator, partial [candidate division Zixibacteria bacterium]|nr:sigma-54 dependent transcriptional regulator [candidate division Zixibacteria bacterium]
RNSHIVGESRAVTRLLDNISRIATSDATVLILGENGTGKELVATRLYLQSKRRDKPFVKVNCPGIPETLFESELFGHVKGSFTGAVKDYPGKFVLGDQGTVFLDEIGDLPLESQAKLLRVLETGEVETLGSVKPKQVNVRIICATNRDLSNLVAERKFREDLFYRVSVLPVQVPSLSERRSDIPLLTGAFLRRYDPSGETVLAPDAIAYLSTLLFPGNVRQLKNLVERLTIFHAGQTIGMAEIKAQVSHSTDEPEHSAKLSLSESLAQFEREFIGRVLEECNGNISKTAERLKTDRANLSKKIRELGLRSD